MGARMARADSTRGECVTDRTFVARRIVLDQFRIGVKHGDAIKWITSVGKMKGGEQPGRQQR